MNHAPEVKIPLLKFYRLLMHDPIGLRTKIFSEYGDLNWKKLKGINNYYVGHPDYAQRILQDNQENYFYKHPLARALFGPFIGMNSLFTTNDLSQWDRDRTICNGSFDPKVYFQEYTEIIVKLTQNKLIHWEQSYKDGVYIDISQEIDPLVTLILMNSLFTNLGIDEHFYVNTINLIIGLIKKKLHTFPLFWHFSSDKSEYQKQLANVRELATSIVKQRLGQPVKWDDLLGHLLREYKDTSQETIIYLLSYQITSFFAVGYLTTSSLLQWLLVQLSYHPDVERRIEEEVNQVIGDRLPKYEDIHLLKYLSAVIKETLRLHPTSFCILRQAIADDSLGGFHIPKEAGITLSTYHIHRHPDFWSNPEGFDPERFLKDPLGQSHPFAYIPFGSGKRRCIGPAFSSLEATLIMAMIVQKFRFTLPPHAKVEPLITTVTTMRPSIKMMRLQRK